MEGIRENIIFNRYFAEHEGYNTYKFRRFFPFNEEQKRMIIGLDIPYHYKKFRKEVLEFEKRLNRIKELVALGQKEVGQKDMSEF